MNGHSRTLLALERALDSLTGPDCPPRIARAIRHAVLASGARLRPRLLAAVARATGRADPALVDQTGAAIELLHCASLVHDDLPCFDDAPLRRGLASVHAAFGEATAVLAGDALIFGAFSVIARVGEQVPRLGIPIMRIVAEAAGLPRGMTAGQAWESEPQIDLAVYHHAKTASLFEAAVMAGSILSRAEPERWRPLGTRIGEAYQILDDLRDVTMDSASLGKPTRRDATLGRPNAALLLGVDAAVARFSESRQAALDAVPDCPGAAGLRRFLVGLFKGLVPPVARVSAPDRQQVLGEES